MFEELSKTLRDLAADVAAIRRDVAAIRDLAGAGAPNTPSTPDTPGTPNTPSTPGTPTGLTAELAPYRDEIGVNLTWASDKLVDDPLGPRLFAHARWYLMGSKDYGAPENFPANQTEPPGALVNVDNVWDGRNGHLRHNAERIVRLLRNYPGNLFLSHEAVLAPHGKRRNWPRKGYTPAELGPDPRARGRELAGAYLKTFELLPTATQSRVVIAPDNEEWGPEPDRLRAYDQWRAGWLDAHREHLGRGGAVALSTGARTPTDYDWGGQRIAAGIDHYPDAFLSHLNDNGGWVNIHVHDRPGDGYLGDPVSRGVQKVRDLRKWLDTRGLTDVKIYVGEYSFQSTPSEIAPDEATRRADWDVIVAQLHALHEVADAVLWYQIEDHDGKEGVFTGTSARKRAELFAASYGIDLAP